VWTRVNWLQCYWMGEWVSECVSFNSKILMQWLALASLHELQVLTERATRRPPTLSLQPALKPSPPATIILCNLSSSGSFSHKCMSWQVLDNFANFTWYLFWPVLPISTLPLRVESQATSDLAREGNASEQEGIP
jgi:hypothetical protein